MNRERDEKLQQVWRTLSAEQVSGGFRVWEVLEVIGEPVGGEPFIVGTADGSYIYVQCSHFWTENAAQRFMADDSFGRWQQVTIV